MANQTRQLSELLRQAGAEVTLVQTNAPYRPSWVKSMPVVRALFRLLPYLRDLWRMAGRCDVVHLMANSGWSWHLFAAPAIWISSWRGTPVVVNYRGGEAREFLERAQRVVRASMRKTAALVVPSAFLEGVFKKFGMPSTIVPNVVDLALFHPRGARVSQAPHVVVARNLEPLYDNATAMRAFALLRKRFPSARMTVAGSGPEETRLRILARELGLDACVHFAGRLDRQAMAALYRDGDVVLNPSLADNMPNSVLEALASGVPVVSTNVGGVPFLVRDGETALLVAPADPQAMAAACQRLLEDGALWSQLAEAGIAEVQRYTWARVAPLLSETYTAAMHSPPTR